jgi:hypothetical protein
MDPQAQLVDLDRFPSTVDPHLTAFPNRSRRVRHFKLYMDGMYLIGPGLAFRRYRLRALESPLRDAAQTTAEHRVDSVGWSASLVPSKGARNGSDHVATR